MATIVPAPAGSGNIAQSFALAARGLGGGLGQLLARRRQQEFEKQDLAKLALFQRQQQAFGGQAFGGQPITQPTLQSQRGRELDFNRAFQAQQPFTLGAGQARFEGGQKTASQPQRPQATKAFNVVNQLVDDPNSPTKFSVISRNQNGEVLGRRAATNKEVNQGVAAEGLQRGTKTKIEKDIIDLQGTLTELDAIKEQFNPDFFTFRGKGRAFFTDLARQLEIPVGQAQKDFLTNKIKFDADSKRVFLKFRKFITGVAGGIEEFKEIAKATIDPEKGSDIAFLAKFDSMRDNAIRTQNVLLAMRNSGLNPTNPAERRQVFKGRSLGTIPLQVPQNVTLDTLGTQQPTGQQVPVPSRQNLTPQDLNSLTLEQLRAL